jgi:hypothetical protein
MIEWVELHEPERIWDMINRYYSLQRSRKRDIWYPFEVDEASLHYLMLDDNICWYRRYQGKDNLVTLFVISTYEEFVTKSACKEFDDIGRHLIYDI